MGMRIAGSSGSNAASVAWQARQSIAGSAPAAQTGVSVQGNQVAQASAVDQSSQAAQFANAVNALATGTSFSIMA